MTPAAVRRSVPWRIPAVVPFLLRTLLVVAVAVAAARAQRSDERPVSATSKPGPAPARVETKSLRKETVRKGELRFGYDFAEKTDLPTVAFAFAVGGVALRAFDLDDDGALAADVDGMALADGRFVVPLPTELLLPEGRFAFEFEKTARVSVRKLPSPFDNPDEKCCGELTLVRLRFGLSPLLVDEDLCAGVRLHVRYREQNPGADLFAEDPERPGYSDHGASVGRNCGDYTDTLLAPGGFEDLACTAVARSTALWPTATHFAACFSRPLRRTALNVRGAPSPLAPFTFPPDGARGVSRGYSKAGEKTKHGPERAVQADMGFPVSVWLPSDWLRSPVRLFRLYDAAGKCVDGHVSTPQNPAIAPDNRGFAHFVPARSLAKNAEYRAVLELEDKERRIEWRFTTGTDLRALPPAKAR
jgi:hypothetical protein